MRLHVGHEVWTHLRSAYPPRPRSHRFPDADPDLLPMLTGIPVVVEAGWPAHSWALLRDGEVTKQGVLADGKLVEAVRYAAGRAPVRDED